MATTHIHPTSATAFSNPEGSSNAHVHAYPHLTSPFHPRSRVAVDSTLVIPYSSSQSSPQDKPVWNYLVVVPPEVDPRQHTSDQIENLIIYNIDMALIRTRMFVHILDLKDQDHTTNINESFETIYGPSIINNPSSFANPFPLSSPSIDINSSNSSFNRNVRSKSSHQLGPPAPPARSSLLPVAKNNFHWALGLADLQSSLMREFTRYKDEVQGQVNEGYGGNKIIDPPKIKGRERQEQQFPHLPLPCLTTKSLPAIPLSNPK